MDGSRFSWDYCQRNSDDILAGGLEQLKSADKYGGSLGVPATAGNYVVSIGNTPMYTGEARDLASRLKQQFRPRTSSFYKNYVKKQSQLGIEQDLKIDDFAVRFIETEIGRKELEEFIIVNLATPLNKFQLAKRDIFAIPLKNGLWYEVQSKYSEIIKDGGNTVLSTKPVKWLEATPFAKPGLYIISDDNNEIVYIGESSNVHDRHGTHSKDTYFSALRRNLGTKLLGFQLQERRGKKRYFDPNEDSQIDDYLKNCTITLQMINFGRLELEEHLIKSIQPILNKKAK
ncbi:MAG: GIY-YIG nuclease family protein [Candidatus Zixiibacteriota bacterium]